MTFLSSFLQELKYSQEQMEEQRNVNQRLQLEYEERLLDKAQKVTIDKQH